MNDRSDIISGLNAALREMEGAVERIKRLLAPTPSPVSESADLLDGVALTTLVNWCEERFGVAFSGESRDYFMGLVMSCLSRRLAPPSRVETPTVERYTFHAQPGDMYGIHRDNAPLVYVRGRSAAEIIANELNVLAARGRLTARPEGKDGHPQQPIVTDEHGVRRFKKNAIVSYIVDWCASKNGTVGYPPVPNGPAPSLNELARMKFSREDRCQLAQLIGYSLSGYDELSYTDAVEAAPPPVARETTREFVKAADALRAEMNNADGSPAAFVDRSLKDKIEAYDAARQLSPSGEEKRVDVEALLKAYHGRYWGNGDPVDESRREWMTTALKAQGIPTRAPKVDGGQA